MEARLPLVVKTANGDWRKVVISERITVRQEWIGLDRRTFELEER